MTPAHWYIFSATCKSIKHTWNHWSAETCMCLQRRLRSLLINIESTSPSLDGLICSVTPGNRPLSGWSKGWWASVMASWVLFSCKAVVMIVFVESKTKSCRARVQRGLSPSQDRVQLRETVIILFDHSLPVYAFCVILETHFLFYFKIIILHYYLKCAVQPHCRI